MKSSNILVILTIFSTCFICLAQNSPQDYLDGHNKARAEVGVPPLSWDDNLAAYAKNYSESKIDSCEMSHSGGPYGENLADGSSDLEMTATDVVNLWVDEKKNYDHATNLCVEGWCDHYIKVVWRDTLRLGCARAECELGWTFFICCYDPRGNYYGGDRPY